MRKLLRGLMRPIGLIGPMGPIRPIRLIGLIGLMGLIGSIGLMGCSSSDDSEDEDVPVTGTPIAFSAKEGEETAVNNGGSNKAPRANETNRTNGANETFGVTRSTPLSEKGIISFHVWGYKNMDYSGGSYGDLQTVFPGYTVHWEENSALTTTTNTDSWEYILTAYPDQTIKYWDWAARAYRFFGVATNGAIISGAYKPSAESPTSYEISFTADATNDEDAPYYSALWFSTGSEALYPTRLFGKPVQLEFKRPFAKVRFMFTYSDPDAVLKPMLEDPDFRPATTGRTIATKCTFTVNYPITGSATKESWSTSGFTKSKLAFTVPYTENDPSKTPEVVGTYHWEMVVPIREQGAYRLTVTINGEEKTCEVPSQYMDWLPGYQYTYIFKVNEEGGVELETVNIGITNWGTGKDADYIVYNW